MLVTAFTNQSKQSVIYKIMLCIRTLSYLYQRLIKELKAMLKPTLYKEKSIPQRITISKNIFLEVLVRAYERLLPLLWR